VPVLVEVSDPLPTWSALAAALKEREQPVDEVHAAVVEAGLRVGPPQPDEPYAPGTAGPARLGAASGGGVHGTCRSGYERGDLGWVCVWCLPRLEAGGQR
jgi:hypothetical protein